ncbi:hypothetical protein L484_008300 [Morus notabilis]|uniref:Uncharacterized protein n=1 Tax=Morus notabilis TaxID=981085 RepID=W9R8H6_9ROSA|nr:hypothetical protein L484_008300 [Morus notabilis]
MKTKEKPLRYIITHSHVRYHARRLPVHPKPYCHPPLLISLFCPKPVVEPANIPNIFSLNRFQASSLRSHHFESSSRRLWSSKCEGGSLT